MAAIKYTSTKLQATGKGGILKPDSDGYYTLVLGGLNVLNSVGEYYTLQGAKELFDKSSIFQRRVSTGNLKGECGHPKKMPGMSMDDYINRIMRVEETNISHHISEVWLDEKYGRDNPQFNNKDLVAIMGKVRPSGEKGSYLKAALDNGKENVCFSIRAITNDFMVRGVNNRILTSILTWDWVTEPGLSLANKFDSPGLESFKMESIDDLYLSKIALERVIKNSTTVCTEDTQTFVSEALKAFKDYTKDTVRPLSHTW